MIHERSTWDNSDILWIILQTWVIRVEISFNAAVAGERHLKKARDETTITDVMPRAQ